MKKEETAKNAKKFSFLIVFLSIICLIFISLFPLISVEENDFIKEDLYFNLEMMRKSDNKNINNLVNYLNIINILFWTLIILGLLSIIGTNILSSGKFTVFGYILLFIGCTNFIISILVINFQIVLMNEIEEIDTITSSAINSHFNYSYVLIIPNILIFIFSILYIWNFSLHSIQKIGKTREFKLLKEKYKEAQVKTEEKKEISSQIEQPTNKNFLVKCPQCKHIFTAEKEDKINKIKCPKCNKEGVIK